ncbi:glycosyltransferase family 2 protein [Wenzhouxiangella sp. AB-CW3]|uniref:glycosyltransferase family 2 protein n=1 Tax=Wenzhouxiangella sp. AB-CW3 TaxID=2771012 RepID=UPI00168B6668|nr:glycosyltransferase family 2 protein [Wenzhouxiangella sp. AB-CW3]QOC23723.1 glycosyltransferase family 2 protein [Wenzhouxiangella sp. AB-CW3]
MEEFPSPLARERTLMSIVVPVMNEALGLRDFASELKSCVESLPIDVEVIFSDDGSTDSSWAIIQDLSVKCSLFRGVSLSRNFGKDAAIMAGLNVAAGDAVLVMDADGQHPIELIPEFVTAWLAGEGEIVEARKTSRPGQGLLTRAAAIAFNRLFTLLAGVDMNDATDFRLMSRSVVDVLLAMPERAVFFRGLSAWTGFHSCVIEFDPKPRADFGKSRFSLFALVKVALRSLISFTSTPLHVVTFTGLTFGVFAIALAIQTLAHWMAGDAVEGFTTVILLLLIIGSAIMLALGIIGLYIGQILDEVKSRPKYLIARKTERC